MDEKEVLAVLIDVVEEIKDDPVDTDAIDSDTKLRDDLEIDSLQTAEMLVEIEERLGVTITDEEAPTLQTVGDVMGLIMQRNPRKNDEAYGHRP